MKTLDEVVHMVGRVRRDELELWVRRSWVIPAASEPEPTFSDLDVARICLISDLLHDVGVEDETIPLVLSLLDQLYATRRRMSALTEAVQRQPEEVRRAIFACVTPRGGPR